jgi:hypothetical protein
MGIPNYQDIIGLLEAGRMAEARQKILELREGALRLQEENLALRERLGRRDPEGEDCRDMYFERGVYWLKKPTDDGTNLVGPFCQVCHDREKKAVRLHRRNAPGGGWYCAVCRNEF